MDTPRLVFGLSISISLVAPLQLMSARSPTIQCILILLNGASYLNIHNAATSTCSRYFIQLPLFWRARHFRLRTVHIRISHIFTTALPTYPESSCSLLIFFRVHLGFLLLDAYFVSQQKSVSLFFNFSFITSGEAPETTKGNDKRKIEGILNLQA
jgi:hypothetical protein